MPRSLAVTKRRRGSRRAATKRFRGGAPKRRRQAAAAAAKSLEVKGPADAKKALELMGKHPMVLILVFANWCPHCHKFMEQWNKYEQTPNRKSPMIRVEQANMGELLPHIKQPDGKPMEVDGFPTVLLNMNKGAVQGNRGAPSENVGTVITDPRNEEFMSNLIKNGTSTIMADEEESEERSDVAVPAASATGSTTTIPTMGTTALNASHYDESMESSQLTNRYRNNNSNESNNSNALNNSNLLNNSNVLSNNVKSAIQSASNSAKRASKEAKSVRSAGSAELSDASARGSFAAPPAKEVSTMKGGAGTCGAPVSGTLMKGGYSKSDTLLAQLRELVGKN